MQKFENSLDFLTEVFFCRYWRFKGQQKKGEDHIYSTLPVLIFFFLSADFVAVFYFITDLITEIFHRQALDLSSHNELAKWVN